MNAVPKVLMFTPIYEGKDYCFKEFLEHVKKFTYPNLRHIIVDNSKDKKYYNIIKKYEHTFPIEVYHIDRGSNSREALARAQNFARKMALEEDYPYMFSLESDIFAPYNIIETLMTSGKDVITGLYFIGKKDIKYPCITLPKFVEKLGAWGTRLLDPSEFSQYFRQGLKKVQAGGFGCCLMYKRTFKDVPFTYDPRFGGHSDIYFFNEMFMKKIPVWVDTDIVCDHKNSDWNDVEDR